MVDKCVLYAPKSLANELPAILRSHGLPHTLTLQRTIGRVRKVDLIGYEVKCESASVHIGIENAHSRPLADIGVIADRKFLFRRHKDSERLAERIVEILREHGAYE
jgi:hypothetical protein